MNLHRYLDEIRRRLRMRLVARAALALVVGFATATGALVLAFVALVPASETVTIARVVLLAAITCAVIVTLMRRFSEQAVARVVEQRIPVLAGRLETWRDTIARGNATPLVGLLERQVIEQVEGHPPGTVVPPKQTAVPAVAAAVVLLAVIVLVVSGSSPWQLSAQRLWVGDALSDAAPRIVIAPGDVVIPRGADVVIEAATSGFVPVNLSMNAAFERTPEWERAPMSRTGTSSFAFVFVGVMEEVEYYVGSDSSGVNSDRYIIRVADLPRITEVKVDYQFPDWTGLPLEQQLEGDLWALPETRVDVQARSSLPLESAVLVVNGREIPVAAEGMALQGSFDVSDAGSWHIAVRHEGILTRISDTYLINLVEDQPPEVAFEWPGHDRRASAIEEVALRFRATDDYGVNVVSLRYAVNGGEWVSAPVPDDAVDAAMETERTIEHMLYLEEMRSPDTDEGTVRELKPGDIVSFYAEVRDHTRDVRSSLYFVDVRPFDRMYREAQSAARDGGGGDQSSESAQRQREIVTATWNLINRAKDGTATEGDQDQAQALAILQRTLKSQVETLIARAGARGLSDDDGMGTFLDELENAVEDMEPAAIELDRAELEAAIAPEQKALQHLLAAEATVRDIDVSQSSSQGRGTSGRSLEELVELELDPERNRYEVPQSPGQGEASDNDDWKKLEELAARKEQLAESNRGNEASLASRWQQERLRRELEDLRERLERRAPGSGSQRRQGSRSAAEALAGVDQALESIDESLKGSESSAQRAGQSLAQTAQQLQQAEIAELEQSLARAGRQVGGLLESQRNIIERLDELRRDVREAWLNGGEVPYYDYSMQPFAEQKERMQQDLAEVTRDVTQAAGALTGQSSEASAALGRALNELAEDRIEGRLAYSAELFREGRPLVAGTQEEMVERALTRLGDSLELARGYIADSASGGNPLAEVRGFRRELMRLGDYGDARSIGAVARDLDQLVAQLNEELGDTLDIDTSLDRELYIARGAAEENTDVLYRMTSDRLDLIENALMHADTELVRAQTPRDRARDSDAASRYFRSLSSSDSE